MRVCHFGYITALAVLSLSTGVAAARCQLQQIGVLPVDMHGLLPVVSTKINGVKARFVLDTGMFYSAISREAAAQYQLPVAPIRGGSFSVVGIGGAEKAGLATAESFEFLGVPLSNVRFLVINQSWGDSAGQIGQNLLQISDVEYDLANGIVRFIKPVGCAGQPLAYWAVSTPYSSVDLQYMDVTHSHLRATAAINGYPVTVTFDTGSTRSLLSLEAAARAGITPSSPGVTFLGATAGIGPGGTKVWVAPVETFQIGGEKVEHAHLPIGNLGPMGNARTGGEDMLLGEDFFLSHRIYVAYSQRKVYFTYNGGPLFNLNLPQVASSAPKPPATPSASQASARTAEQPESDAPTDSDGFRRRGMAYASMREFDRALADLTRACELAPRDAESHYDRGVTYAQDGQYKSALVDFDATVMLQPDDIDAHLARAELLQFHPDASLATAAAEIKSDLDAVDRLAAPAANVRMTVGELYGSLGDYSAAIDQINQWLSYRRLEGDRARGLNELCRLRATANQDLHEALDDCNRALDLRPDLPERFGIFSAQSTHISADPETAEHPNILDSRALVYLRLDNLKDAIRDYDSALRINSNMPTSLYGRGLAELRLGEKAQGQADLAAAEKLYSGIAERFAKMGLAPP